MAQSSAACGGADAPAREGRGGGRLGGRAFRAWLARSQRRAMSCLLERDTKIAGHVMALALGLAAASGDEPPALTQARAPTSFKRAPATANAHCGARSLTVVSISFSYVVCRVSGPWTRDALAQRKARDAAAGGTRPCLFGYVRSRALDQPHRAHHHRQQRAVRSSTTQLLAGGWVEYTVVGRWTANSPPCEMLWAGASRLCLRTES